MADAGITPTLDAERRVAELEAQLAALTLERDHLRLAYRSLQLELELMRRRLYLAKAERLDTAQLELEFAHKLAALDALNKQLGLPPTPEDGDDDDDDTKPRPGKRHGTTARKPTGRRDLREADLPEDRIELLDPTLEGQAARNGWEESYRLHWRRAGFVKLVVARAKYRDPDVERDDPADLDTPTIVTAPLPPQILPRAMATAALLAHLFTEKWCYGMPFHRQEARAAHLGTRLDRGLMCRWAEEIGSLVGSGVVEAMRQEALRTAFCIATDATGVLVQPIPGGAQTRRACRRAHFLVQIADADHIFFEYMAKETSATIGALFQGFGGYVLADAKSTFDILFRPPASRPPPDDDDDERAGAARLGCWSHCRRKFWEAAITTKEPVAREGIVRIKRIFDLDRTWRDKPADEIKALRELHLRPHTDAFFAWVAEEYERVRAQRGLLRSALGYALRQRGPLTRFFEDGRLPLTNNQSERELRRIATGRRAWLFVGSDDHGQAAGNLLTLIASARLHQLDPEAYLRDLFRVHPHWPRDRYLELAPRYWTATRARLDAAQLERELGPLTIPAPPAPSEQPAAR